MRLYPKGVERSFEPIVAVGDEEGEIHNSIVHLHSHRHLHNSQINKRNNES